MASLVKLGGGSEGADTAVGSASIEGSSIFDSGIGSDVVVMVGDHVQVRTQCNEASPLIALLLKQREKQDS